MPRISIISGDDPSPSNWTWGDDRRVGMPFLLMVQGVPAGQLVCGDEKYVD